MSSYREMKRRELLQKIGAKLRPEERSDFNMDRWLDAYNDDIEQCAHAIDEYAQNRILLGWDRDEAFVNFYGRSDVRLYCSIFPQSKLDSAWVNQLDNGLVFVEMAPAEPGRAVKRIRAGQFLATFFGWCEHMLRLILARERATGCRSFAVCLFDLRNVPILQYANPMGPVNRLFEARVHLAMAYYAEMLSRVVIMNPPRFLGILLKIISFILPAKIIGRFHVAQSVAEASKWISMDAIPLGLGGMKTLDDNNILPNGCIKINNLAGEEESMKDGTIWRKYSLAPVQYEHIRLAAGQSYVREFDTPLEGQKLLYEVNANRAFEIKAVNEKGELVLPHLYLCTPQLAEESAIHFSGDQFHVGGRVRFELKNVSRLFSLKLRIAMQLI